MPPPMINRIDLDMGEDIMREDMEIDTENTSRFSVNVKNNVFYL